MALLISIADDHAGYRKGDVVLWQPGAPTPFYHVPHPDCLTIIKQSHPGIATITSSTKAPWITRAQQATPPPATGYGKR